MQYFREAVFVVLDAKNQGSVSDTYATSFATSSVGKQPKTLHNVQCRTGGKNETSEENEHSNGVISPEAQQPHILNPEPSTLNPKPPNSTLFGKAAYHCRSTSQRWSMSRRNMADTMTIWGPK